MGRPERRFDHRLQNPAADAAVTYEDTSVAAGTRYVYRVVAMNAAGDAPRSSYVNVETP